MSFLCDGCFPLRGLIPCVNSLVVFNIFYDISYLHLRLWCFRLLSNRYSLPSSSVSKASPPERVILALAAGLTLATEAPEVRTSTQAFAVVLFGLPPSSWEQRALSSSLVISHPMDRYDSTSVHNPQFGDKPCQASLNQQVPPAKPQIVEWEQMIAI